MILDWRQDAAFADLHEIIDAETGQPLPMVPPWDAVCYADDEAGILRTHRFDQKGLAMLVYSDDPSEVVPEDDMWTRKDAEGNTLNRPMEVATDEHRKAIKIVRKSEVQS